MKHKDYDKDWNEYFQLDTESPSGLLRFKDGRGKLIKKYAVGHRAFKKNGAPVGWALNFQDKLYAIHRIIWVLIYGHIDHELVIDHLDGNPFNNQKSNLSLKTLADNARNHRKHCNNSSGITGVKLTNSGKGHWYYTAFWNEVNGKMKQKHFSVLKLGEETAKSFAIAYRTEQIQRLILEGADYTDRHGN